MKLNGWQRLWVFVSIPFVLVGSGMVADEIVNMHRLQSALPHGHESLVDWIRVAGGLMAAVAFPLAMYAMGWGIAWVRRGFGAQWK